MVTNWNTKLGSITFVMNVRKQSKLRNLFNKLGKQIELSEYQSKIKLENY